MAGSSYDEQLAAIRSRQVYDQRVSSAARSANPMVALNVAAQFQAYPWMASQTVYGAEGR